MQSAIGKYLVDVDYDCRYIFPKDENGKGLKTKDGKSLMILIDKIIIELRHAVYGEVTFKRYLFRGKWLWSDSRMKGSCGEDHAVTEIARMLYERDSDKAKDFLVGLILNRPEPQRKAA